MALQTALKMPPSPDFARPTGGGPTEFWSFPFVTPPSLILVLSFQEKAFLKFVPGRMQIL